MEHVKEAAYTMDGSRAFGANMGWVSPVKPRTMMSDALDVMGFSHDNYATILAFHKMEPGKPLVMTVCGAFLVSPPASFHMQLTLKISIHTPLLPPPFPTHAT